MSAKKRVKILKNANRLNENAKHDIEGQTDFLVDDEYTSGATANSCARMLKMAGEKNLDHICWVRVLPDFFDADRLAICI